jgi:protein-S-isoprenylcysteine O-methyltransferase Ste14/rhodanese-related sulfurtransferase
MQWLERLQESRLPTIALYALALAVIVIIGLETGFSARDLSAVELAAFLVAAIPAGFLMIFSLSGLIAYFLFMPSVKHDGHIFARVHGTHLLHPLTTAVVLGLLAVCILTGSVWGSVAWIILLAAYILQTVLILKWVSREHLMNGSDARGAGRVLLALHLILGGELVTVAAGARPLPPWRLGTLPEDTWILDVRTKSEFYWNRMQAAENYPWGAGVVEASQNRPKDRPVLVVCLSGHRSPTVALMLTRLGFKTVYNLNWGLLYLILLERGKRSSGPFSLTRPHRDINRRGTDFRGISYGYIAFALLTLICAPLENMVFATPVTIAHQIIGGILGLGGLLMGALSFRALGRNFRVFAAPRRSGTLVKTGVYAWVRHPMYTGVVMGLLGYAIAWDAMRSLVLVVGCAIFYVIKGVKEERLLREKYPEYDAYARHTWKFIPYVY